MRRKLTLILNFMTSQTGKQIITISYYPRSKGNISKFFSRRKGNQPIKFGQLIEYKRIRIFLEKSHIKCGGEASPRTFHKKLKLRISLDQLSEMLHSLFYLYVQYCLIFCIILKKNVCQIIFYLLTKLRCLVVFTF